MNKRKQTRDRGRRKIRRRLLSCVMGVAILTLLVAAALPSRIEVRPAEPGADWQSSEAVHSAKGVLEVSSPVESAQQPDQEDWNLILVNPWNPIPEEYQPVVVQLKNGQAVDERCYPDLQAMIDTCRAAGLSPVICSSYRTQEKQERLFFRQVDQLLARGYSSEDARAEAGKSVAVPGTSEHQLGLAVDIVDLNNQNLNRSQENTPVQKWLMEHSWEYGFILRYPNDKSDRTGIIYEPWHYRYVGVVAATEMYEQGICLEEYLES